MATSAAVNKSSVARAAAILTTGEVAATSFILNNSHMGEVSIDLDFTLGSLTNVILRSYVSSDGTTWRPIADVAGNVSYTLTADAATAYVYKCPGWRHFRVSVQGTGTVTGSSATIRHRWLQAGSQG